MALLMWQLSLILVLSPPTQPIGHDLPSLAIYSCFVMRPVCFYFFAFHFITAFQQIDTKGKTRSCMFGHMALIFQEQFLRDNTELKMIFFGRIIWHNVLL